MRVKILVTSKDKCTNRVVGCKREKKAKKIQNIKHYMLILTCHSWAYQIHKGRHKIIEDCNVLSKKAVKPPSISPQFLQLYPYPISKSRKP